MNDISSFLEQQMDQFLSELETYFADQYESNKVSLESKEIFISRKMNETMQNLQEAEALAIQGLTCFQKNKQTLPIVKKMIENKNSVPSSNLSAQEYLSLSDEEMAQLYHQARLALNEGNFQESTGMFIFLITLNGTNFEYPLGAALSLFLSGKNREAEDYYNLALTLAGNDPKTSLFAADFFYCTDQAAKASQLIEQALIHFESKEDPLFHEAEILKSKIDKALSS